MQLRDRQPVFLRALHFAWFTTDLLLASAHVVLYKRDSRAAIGWVGIIWLVPILGSVLYILLGINRIQRRAITACVAPSTLGATAAIRPFHTAPGNAGTRASTGTPGRPKPTYSPYRSTRSHTRSTAAMRNSSDPAVTNCA